MLVEDPDKRENSKDLIYWKEQKLKEINPKGKFRFCSKNVIQTP